ncbi:hypothetical protein HXV84_07935 [Pseudomonas amygdali pv. morsprunorum]|nr:hypothetical protein [Pseudomonas amygdali pv. morsprunorum]
MIKAALLTLGHATGTHHETLDAAVRALFAFFDSRRLWVRNVRISHQRALT